MNRQTAAKKSQGEVIANLMSMSVSSAASLRVLPNVLREVMEDVHGKKFRVVISHDPAAPLILIRLV